MNTIILAVLGTVTALAVFTKNFDKKIDLVFGVLGAMASSAIMSALGFYSAIGNGVESLVATVLGTLAIIYTSRIMQIIR